jgi:hypothetical protein
MRVEFFDKQHEDNPLNGELIDSSRELETIFGQLRHKKPFGLQLKGENGFLLDICLAETYGAVQHTASDGDSAYLLAVAPGSSPISPTGELGLHSLAFRVDEENGVQSPEFLVGGTLTPIPRRYILPYDLVKKIAVHFLETGEREPDVSWEQI